MIWILLILQDMIVVLEIESFNFQWTQARENTINKLLEKIIQQDGVEPDCPSSAETPDAEIFKS